MFFNIAIYFALAVFGIGLFYKISTWFRYSLGIEAAEIPTSRRIVAAAKGIFLTLFSKKILILARVFILDVLLQTRILRESVPRWFMHMGIFGGFMLLLIMHALEGLITSKMFPDYSPTLNPFLFLRNLSLAMVLLGMSVAVYRRFFKGAPAFLQCHGSLYPDYPGRHNDLRPSFGKRQDCILYQLPDHGRGVWRFGG